MPRDSRNPRIGISSRRNGMNTLTRFRMEDLQPISTTAYLITSAADESTVEAPAHATHGSTVIARDSTLADPVRCIP